MEREEQLREKLWNKILVSGALAVLLYLLFLVWSDWHEFTRAMSRFPVLYLAPVLCLAFMNYLTRFWKFYIYLGLLDIHIPRLQAFKIFLSGFAGTVTPGKLGEVLKSVFLKRDAGAALSRTAPIVVAERVTDLIALLLLTFVGLGRIKGGWITVGAGIGLVVLILVLTSSRSLVNGILDRLAKRKGRLAGLADRLSTAYESSRVLLAAPNLPFVTLISVFSWSCEASGFYIVLHGFGQPLSFELACFIYCFSTLVGALVMLPGGIGATEGSMTALLIKFGTTKPEAVASTLVIRACTLWFAVLLGASSLAALTNRPPAAG